MSGRRLADRRKVTRHERALNIAIGHRYDIWCGVLVIIETDDSSGLRHGRGCGIRTEFAREMLLKRFHSVCVKARHPPKEMKPTGRGRQHVRRRRQIIALADPCQYSQAVVVS